MAFVIFISAQERKPRCNPSLYCLALGCPSLPAARNYPALFERFEIAIVFQLATVTFLRKRFSVQQIEPRKRTCSRRVLQLQRSAMNKYTIHYRPKS